MAVNDPTAFTASHIGVERLSDWRGRSVVDPDGEKVGTLEDVLYDGQSDTPAFASVKSGRIGKHLTLVPLAGATVGRDYVRVAHAKAQIKDSPNFDTDAELTVEDEASAYAAYGLAYAPVGTDGRRLARR